MKKIITITLLVTISTLCFSQQISPTPPLTKQDYFNKSKSQKTTAWILLAGGGIIFSTGMIIGLNDASDALISIFSLEPKEPSSTGPILLIAGTVTMLGSIPLFVAASRNKKKGLSISFKNENSLKLQNGGIVKCIIPSLSLKIVL